MKKFKIGGKIILEDNVSYRILDMLYYNGEKYLFCCTEVKPIESKILHCIEEYGEVYVGIETNEKIIWDISKKIINNDSKLV